MLASIALRYHFLQILPFQDSFYYTTSLAQNINLNQEILRINYLKFSPYKEDSKILAFPEQGKIMLWFYQKEIQAPFIVPEGFLLYHELKKRGEDAIYIVKGHVQKIFILKKSHLVASYALRSLDEMKLRLSQERFGIDRRVFLEEGEYEALCQEARSSLSLKELYRFKQFEMDFEKIQKSLLEKLAYPVALLILIGVAIHALHLRSLHQEIDHLEKSYLAKKEQNAKIQEALHQHNRIVKRYQEFADHELLYLDPIVFLNSLYHLLQGMQREKMTLKSLTMTQGEVSLQIETDANPVLFLNQLNNNPYIKSVVIQNIYKPRRGSKVVRYDLMLKPIEKI